MNGIDGRMLRDAAAYVDECSQTATIHTVTISLNGAHGGADVIIEGEVPDDESVNGVQDYERKYEVHHQIEQDAPTCDVCESTEIADCICGEMYLCAEHLTAWEQSPISHDDMDTFLTQQRAS